MNHSKEQLYSILHDFAAEILRMLDAARDSHDYGAVLSISTALENLQNGLGMNMTELWQLVEQYVEEDD